MEMNKAGVALMVALGVGVGAGGAYFATRGNTLPLASQEMPLASVDSTPPADAELSEALVTPLQDTVAGNAAQSGVRGETSGDRVASARPIQAPRQRSGGTSPAPEAGGAGQPAAPPVIVQESRPVATPAGPEPNRGAEPDVLLAPEPPEPQFEELIVSADSVIGLQVETPVSSEQARVEDAVIARVTRDVRVGDRVAIPAGAKAHGEVTLVERGGKVRERARLGVRFTSIALADGTRVAIDTDTIFRDGNAPSGESAAKIGGGAIGGAIIGGILGGAKGAVIGGSAGAGAGTAAVMAGGRNPATLPAGTPVTVRLIKPSTVTVDR
ncbi:MAG: hypothetical protein ABL993_02745 [Vicinamibacterales bacterium]